MMNNKRWNSHKGHSTHARSFLRDAYESAQRDYDQPINSQKLIPDDYDRVNGKDNEWNDKVTEGVILVIEAE